MRWLIPLALLVLVTATTSADTLCSQQEDESWGNLLLHGFQVEAYKPVRVGDKVCYSFYLKNSGSSDVKLGKKGVYLYTNDGDLSSNSGVTISLGKSIFVKDCFVASSSGEWTTYPGVCVYTSKGEVCHNFETSCTFDVYIECPENWSCMTAEDASHGNYVRYSDELCGYTITGLTALNKVPMYCYREASECPAGTWCVTQGEAEKNGMIPTGIFCDYRNGQEMYCYSEGKPDLTISDVWAYNTTPGVYSELRAFVYNRGHGYAGKFSVAFFIDGSYVGEAEVDGLGANENTVTKLSYPHPCEGETDTFAAQVDYHNEVDEENEGNNYLESPRIFQCSEGGMPNLKVAEAFIEYNYRDYCRPFSYQNSSLMIGVRNAGEQVSPETSGWVYIDNHSAGSFRIPSLHPREGVQSIRLRYNLICSGTADTIRIVLDNTNQVPESNEDDNEYTFTAECIKTPTGVADLIIRQAWLETIGTFEWKIGYEIKNQGDGYACASQTGLYVDNTLKADDYVDRLAPGESVEKTFWWNYSMEDCTPPSDTIRIYADYRAAIPETNESNNEYSLSCECMEVPTTPIQKPDLVVLQCSYSYPVLTDDVTVRCRIMNRGYAPAPPSTAKLYIGYQEFDTESVPQLEPGDSVDITFDRIWHPRTTTYFVANYSIEVVVDSDNVVDEIPYEDNNIWRTYWEFPLTCDDGIQNRDEEGVDCGGSFCIPCGDPCDPTTPLPRHFDWRDYYTFPPIRNQGNCGSCWAHSAIGAVEGTYIVKRRVQSIDLSEQELISCSDAGSCSGGQYHRALEYIKNNGVVEESCFPYCACDTSCSKCSDWNSKLWGIASYHVITSRNVEEIKRALICHGPLAAKSSYSSHAMVIVGYDDFLNGGSWIMRNSHGPGSCDNGYCYVLYSRGDEIKILDQNMDEVTSLRVDFEPWKGMIAGNVDGSPGDEIILASISDGRFYIYDASGTILWSFDRGYMRGDGLTVGDVNGDGVDEIIHGNNESGQIAILNPSTGDPLRIPVNYFNKWDGLACGDVDGDGVDKVIHGDINNDTISIYYTDIYVSFEVNDFQERDGLDAGDLDGNGKDEIIYASRAEDKIYIYNKFGDKIAEINAKFDRGDLISSGDIDGDGDDDIILVREISGEGKDKIYIFKSSVEYGELKFDQQSFDFGFDYYGYKSGDRLDMGDLNNDGKDETIYGINTANTDYKNYVAYVELR